MIFKRLKQLFCKHEFHFLVSYFDDNDAGVGYKKVEKFIIYCPKCKKKEVHLKYDYEAIMNKQKIDKEYTIKIERMIEAERIRKDGRKTESDRNP